MGFSQRALCVAALFSLNIGVCVRAEPPYCGDDHVPAAWFVTPAMGDAFTGPGDPARGAAAAWVVGEAQAGWRRAGLDEDAVEHAGRALDSAVRHALAGDAQGLVNHREAAGLVPSSAAQARLRGAGERLQTADRVSAEQWDQMGFRERYALALRHDPDYAVPVTAAGRRVVVGVGDEFMQRIPNGYGVRGSSATFLPQTEWIAQAYRVPDDARRAHAAVAIELAGAGVVWWEINLAESAHAPHWHLTNTHFWSPDGLVLPNNGWHLHAY